VCQPEPPKQHSIFGAAAAAAAAHVAVSKGFQADPEHLQKKLSQLMLEIAT